MSDPKPDSADWTEPERWVWERISAGEPADLNERDRERDAEFKDLDPSKEDGWGENRRLRAKFLQIILTQRTYTDATPYGGARILGALVDDAPIDLERARLHRTFWLERSRVLTDVKARNIRVDGELSFEGCFVAGHVEFPSADIREGSSVARGKFCGELDLGSASIGSHLDMIGSTFEQKVSLNGAKVNGGARLRGGATFKGEVDLGSASIGSVLDMKGSTFKGEVDLGSASIGSYLAMIGSTFERKVNLNGAKVNGGAFLRGGSTFKGELNLVGANIGSHLEMDGSTFERKVNLNGAKVNGAAFLRDGATFKGEVDLGGASIGPVLDMIGSTFERKVNLNGAKVNSPRWLDLQGRTQSRSRRAGEKMQRWCSATRMLEPFKTGGRTRLTTLGPRCSNSKASPMIDSVAFVAKAERPT